MNVRVSRWKQPPRTVVSFRDVDYEMDVAQCRAALARRRIEGQIDSMDGLARSVGRSRSTVSRFFAGRQTSLTVAVRILDRLDLTFADVFTRRSRDPGGRAGPVLSDRSA